MNETFEEQVDRLKMMVEDDGSTWDLSTNDKAAIKAVLGEIDKLKGRREHTHNWYASHYAKLHDWARKILPEPWRNQFFSCVANGTYSHTDVGEAYMCKAGFMVTPSGYIHMDDAKGQIIREQTTRAEEAEAALEEYMARDKRGTDNSNTARLLIENAALEANKLNEIS